MTQALVALILAIVIAEIALNIDWRKRVGVIAANLEKTVRLMANASVSDHFKERLVPRYALRSLGASALLFCILIVVFSPVFLLFVIQFAGWHQDVDIFSPTSMFIMLLSSVAHTTARLTLFKRNK